MDVRCPLGLIVGDDWYSCPECEFMCKNEVFYVCKDKRHSCTHKADLGSWTYATYQARQMSKKGREMQAYSCKYCGGWHVGSSY